MVVKSHETAHSSKVWMTSWPFRVYFPSSFLNTASQKMYIWHRERLIDRQTYRQAKRRKDVLRNNAYNGQTDQFFAVVFWSFPEVSWGILWRGDVALGQLVTELDSTLSIENSPSSLNEPWSSPIFSISVIICVTMWIEKWKPDKFWVDRRIINLKCTIWSNFKYEWKPLFQTPKSIIALKLHLNCILTFHSFSVSFSFNST